MAISDTQKVDYLWKKIGYGVAKTDTDTNKKAYEESTASPLLLRGDKLWAQSGSIPGTIPATSSSIVQVYKDGVGSWTATVKATADATATLNRTWQTGVTDWIPVEFGPTFQVQVYIDGSSSTTPQSTGTKIFAAGSGNSDEWYFDYQAGVLNFIGTNLPSGLIAGKSIFIAGARYIGSFGISGSISSTSADLGNIHIQENTISSKNVNGNIVLTPDGTGNVQISSNLSIATGNLVTANANLGNLATANFVNVANDLSVSGNASITGNLKVLGTVSYINSATTYITDPLTETGGGPNGAALLSNDNKDRGSLLHYYTNKAVDAFIGWDNSNAEFALAANVTTTDNVVTYNDFGNIRVGNLTSLNANLGNLATANFFSGDGGLLSNLSAANISGSASLSNVSANSLTTSAIISGDLTITNVTSDTVIDSFTPSTYRTAKYIIKASSDAGYESLEVLLIHDGSNSFITIYGAISTIDDDIITLTSNIASGNVKLYATGSSANTVVNLVGTYVTD
jgi:hypothetical protein